MSLRLDALEIVGPGGALFPPLSLEVARGTVATLMAGLEPR